ncbi:MAG: hypothetical protein A2V70_07535 [Planctomycetes bacterium RBG_13_63_9]|nr:MAG: hypothetical protein A2V70_07535 [Planctomycetes bacterium RBG_13_63_9]
MGVGALLAIAPLLCWLSHGPPPAGADDGKATTETSPAETDSGDHADPAEESDSLGANAACYICHIPFVKEELSKVHLKAKVGCIKCHGLSADHANDENIGATKPDVLFGRKEIGPSCRECHPNHNVPPQKIVARFLQRNVAPKPSPVCTDCHGSHKIERPEEENLNNGNPAR